MVERDVTRNGARAEIEHEIMRIIHGVYDQKMSLGLLLPWEHYGNDFRN